MLKHYSLDIKRQCNFRLIHFNAINNKHFFYYVERNNDRMAQLSKLLFIFIVNRL